MLLCRALQEPVLFRYLFSEHHEAEHRCYHQPEPHRGVYGTSRYQLQQFSWSLLSDLRFQLPHSDEEHQPQHGQ